ncbi:hypothetical protein [Halalkalicoccus jeotgali]|uniref:CHAT domain-containing protein n=1 Tax=Halalkalicoccus jeotgali (strain DSM 18796 / CECT 7217 / JCM 14584 / KCTC 4019 / B3) TaxID=795797 RepID=D8J935_HALJB|nr:hypothetical protein [Halalkalicoccus jeotgali]ADJ16304.1 hypothetical protein HacjB3_14615 [Halalkalicoccus jeotgali B3]ELY37038.1 hypothetical protein C497_09853 [Halalkalicoccus jeotgali B3]
MSRSASSEQSAAIRFEYDDGTLGVVDTVERRRYSLSLAGSNRPTRTDGATFRFPVDSAVTVDTEAIVLPTGITVYVRDVEGRMLAETRHTAQQSFPEGSYSLELCAPMKIYVRVEGPFEIGSDAERTTISLPERTTVSIGARSKHDRPAATVTTTDDPEDVMAAISTFGSALKTTSPERSYPTLRGHPPTLERGSTLSIPDGLTPPETGITIEVPATLRHAYVVAPLAYYLGATVEPGDRPLIRTDSGFVHPMGTDGTFESAVERTLKQSFLLDCVTRTEGLYPIDLHERRAIEPHVDLDFATLYDRPIGDRLEAYLSVPYPTIEPHLPEWKLTSHVAPFPASIEMLPFLVDDLAVIRTPDVRRPAPTRSETTAIEGFLRNSTPQNTRKATAAASAAPESYVEPRRTESLEHAWVGDETPMGASKATPQAYRNRLAREQSGGDISIAVVCNDPQMDEERDLVDDVYGSREELPFEVAIHRDLTREELSTVLETDVDFLHYVGHIEPDGFECSDGRLDARSLETVGVDAFLLNGCRSYDQGMALIDGGAIGGIVTLTDVINTGAVTIGSALARLLNNGFPLRAALEVAKDEDVAGEQYIVVGDGGMSVTQAEGGVALLCTVEKSGDGYDVKLKTYPTNVEGMGSIVYPTIGQNREHYINSGSLREFECTTDELQDFFVDSRLPIRVGGDLYWSDQVSIEDF